MQSTQSKNLFLPTSLQEVKALGWDWLDVILFSGDAYIDHPSFGIAVVARVLENIGLRVAVVSQPNWRDDLRDFKKLGTPRLFFGVSSGNMDSMVNHYTANKRLRRDDAYTPAGNAGMRPDYACTVYSQILKKLYPNVPIVIGGIEASLRRLTHYDYWSDSLKPSILADSGADLLLYGMAELPLKMLALRLKNGEKIHEITNLPQSAYITNEKPDDEIPSVFLHTFEQCKSDKKKYARNFQIFEEESNKMEANRIIEAVGKKFVVVNPPCTNLSQEDIDAPYELPYTRLPHPRYSGKGAIPAYEMIRNSINIHRGCFGGCSFCTISAHQGKFIQSRSEQSILNELHAVVNTPGFNGTISDLGGPSANMYQMQGRDLEICRKCKKPSCIFPRICANLNTEHGPMLELYKKAEAIKGVKHLYIGSGVRYDLFYDRKTNRINPSTQAYMQQLIGRHVSGRLKVAPEHTSDRVLNLMRKPSFLQFKRFNADFEFMSRKVKKNQQLIPYFISSHPASTLADMAALAIETKQLHFKLEQVQDFTPTPMTLSSCIYYTGFDPFTGEKVFSPRKPDDKKDQQSFFFWYKPEMRRYITTLLDKIGKRELGKKLL